MSDINEAWHDQRHIVVLSLRNKINSLSIFGCLKMYLRCIQKLKVSLYGYMPDQPWIVNKITDEWIQLSTENARLALKLKPINSYSEGLTVHVFQDVMQKKTKIVHEWIVHYVISISRIVILLQQWQT